jgi:hypothetical protein
VDWQLLQVLVLRLSQIVPVDIAVATTQLKARRKEGKYNALKWIRWCKWN